MLIILSIGFQVIPLRRDPVWNQLRTRKTENCFLMLCFFYAVKIYEVGSQHIGIPASPGKFKGNFSIWTASKFHPSLGSDIFWPTITFEDKEIESLERNTYPEGSAKSQNQRYLENRNQLISMNKVSSSSIQYTSHITHFITGISLKRCVFYILCSKYNPLCCIYWICLLKLLYTNRYIDCSCFSIQCSLLQYFSTYEKVAMN